MQSNCFKWSREHSHHTCPRMTLRSLLCFIKLLHLWKESENIVYNLWTAVKTVDIISPNKKFKGMLYMTNTSIFGFLVNVLYSKTFYLPTPLPPLCLRHYPGRIFKLFKWILVLYFENFNYIFLNILIKVKLFAILAFRAHLVTKIKNSYQTFLVVQWLRLSASNAGGMVWSLVGEVPHK